MNILEKIKELKALRAELSENDIEEKQAYTEAIVNLVKQMGKVEETATLTSTAPLQPVVSQNTFKNTDFEFKETDMPENSISQIKSKTKYIPQ